MNTINTPKLTGWLKTQTIPRPENGPTEAEWFTFIAILNRLKYEEINQKSVLGFSIFEGLKRQPWETINELRDDYLDNPRMLEQIIGTENLNLIILSPAK
jgi:hypothetical protein